MIGVKYIGIGPCPVRINDAPILADTVITGPADVLAMLAERADFEAIEDKPQRAKAAATEPEGDE